MNDELIKGVIEWSWWYISDIILIEKWYQCLWWVWGECFNSDRIANNVYLTTDNNAKERIRSLNDIDMNNF